MVEIMIEVMDSHASLLPIAFIKTIAQPITLLGLAFRTVLSTVSPKVNPNDGTGAKERNNTPSRLRPPLA